MLLDAWGQIILGTQEAKRQKWLSTFEFGLKIHQTLIRINLHNVGMEQYIQKVASKMSRILFQVWLNLINIPNSWSLNKVVPLQYVKNIVSSSIELDQYSHFHWNWCTHGHFYIKQRALIQSGPIYFDHCSKPITIAFIKKLSNNIISTRPIHVDWLYWSI